jgi:hypothetical protein
MNYNELVNKKYADFVIEFVVVDDNGCFPLTYEQCTSRAASQH